MTFGRRLGELLGDRRLTPWALHIGLGRDALRALRAGRLPGEGSLQRICRVEGVRRRWLTEGRGPAFTVAEPGSDDATALALATMLTRHPGWRAHVLGEGPQGVVVLTRPAELARPRCRYTIVAVVSGEVGARTLAVLGGHGGWHRVATDAASLAALRAGRIGTYALVGDAGTAGLLDGGAAGAAGTG